MAPGILTHAHKLWLFQLAAEAGSFREASHRAGITQSALSQSLAALEKYLGKTLFVRHRSGITLTPDGIELLEKAIPVLKSLDSLDPCSLQRDPKLRKKVRLGIYESMAINFFPLLLPSIQMKYPGFDLEVRTGRSHHLSMLVDRGDLDMALVAEHSLHSRLEAQVFADDTLSLYVAKDSPISAIGWDALKCFGVGTLAPAPDGYPRYFQQFMKSIQSRSRVVLRSDSFETLRSLAMCESLVAVLPDRVSTRDCGNLVRLEWPCERPEHGLHDFYLILRRNVDQQVRRIMIDELNAMPGKARVPLTY